MIQFTHTYKTYSGGQLALRDINLQIDKGEFVFLVGPSGAGKTTLFRLISAYDRASSGAVNVAGYDLNKISAAELPYFRRRIGVVYQDFRLLKKLTVFENVALPLEIRGERPYFVEGRVRDVLASVGLAHRLTAYPEQLSGGEQQRVAIARALIHQPGVLVADEPTGNLDQALSHEIMELFESVNAQGTTVFIATHDQQMIKRRQHRTIHLQSGQVSTDGGAHV